MNKYFSRVTSSSRGETFNPLMWPFLLSTFSYGIGFAFILPFTKIAGTSSLFNAMSSLGNSLPIIWGAIAIITILCGLTFLMFNIPPVGKASGLAGACLWLFASSCYIATGEWLVLLSVAVPNLIFWIWQYFSLSQFRREDAIDEEIIEEYHRKD